MATETMDTETAMTTLDATDDVLRQRAEALACEVDEEQVEDLAAFLRFRVGPEWYAIGVEHVREIYQEYDIAPLPCTPQFVLGVVNIRGEIISVVDLALMMHLEEIGTRSAHAPAVVVENGSCVTAVVVDEIGDIAEVPIDSIEPPVHMIDRYQAEFAVGAVPIGDTMIGLLNAERILEPVDEGSRR